MNDAKLTVDENQAFNTFVEKLATGLACIAKVDNLSTGTTDVYLCTMESDDKGVLHNIKPYAKVLTQLEIDSLNFMTKSQMN